MISDKKGNFAVPTALLLIPMIGCVGLALEYGRVLSAKDKLQADLDRAMTLGVKEYANVGPVAALDDVRQAMEQSATHDQPYTFTGMVLSRLQNDTGFRGEANATVPAGLFGILGSGDTPIQVRSEFQTRGTGKLYYEVSLMIDKTMSMLEPVTQEGMDIVASVKSLNWTNCQIACHTMTSATRYGDQLTLPAVVDGKTYPSAYVYARSRNVLLRTDVQDLAAKAIIDTLEGLDPDHKRISLGIYAFGASTTFVDFMQSLQYPGYPDEYNYRIEQSLRQVLSPTFDMVQVRRAFATNPELDKSLGHNVSDFRAITLFPRFLGVQGDGSSPDRPKRLVILITDGFQTQYGMPLYESSYMGPMNPDWCKPVKDLGIDLAVLGIDYLPIKRNSISNYNSAMKGIYYKFNDAWGTSLPLDSNVSKISLLKPALTACASTPNDYFPASDTDRIRGYLTDKLSTGGSYDGSWTLSE